MQTAFQALRRDLGKPLSNDVSIDAVGGKPRRSLGRAIAALALMMAVAFSAMILVLFILAHCALTDVFLVFTTPRPLIEINAGNERPPELACDSAISMPSLLLRRRGDHPCP